MSAEEDKNIFLHSCLELGNAMSLNGNEAYIHGDVS
jgi:hypothetical protein